jgi:hypothetical protein
VIGTFSRPFDLLKGPVAAQGETRVWADGQTHKKVGKRWITVRTAGGRVRSTKAKVADVWRAGQQHFDFAMTTNLGDEVEAILHDEGIDSYEDLVAKIKTGTRGTAHKLYKKLVDRIRTVTAPPSDKGAALHMIGSSLVKLNEVYAAQPKVKVTVKTTSKTGKEYYRQIKGEELPTLKASSVATAKRKMGGWSVTGPLTSKHVRAMIKKKSAKLVSGKIDSKKKWHLPKKSEDMQIKYKGNHLLIRVKQVRKGKERTRASAKVEVKVPYAFAKAYLLKQVESRKVAKNLIFRMENSSGYRKFLSRSGA